MNMSFLSKDYSVPLAIGVVIIASGCMGLVVWLFGPQKPVEAPGRNLAKQVQPAPVRRMVPITAPTQPTKEEKAEPADDARRPEWEYSETEDKMGRGKFHHALLESINLVALQFPYQDPQPAMIDFTSYQGKRSAMFGLEHGIFDGGADCHINLVCDGGAVQRFDCEREGSGMSNMLTIKDYDRFYAAFSTATLARIECFLYKDGAQYFDFGPAANR